MFAGALRLVKMWARRRDVYGGAAGYLGGAGWATRLARVTADGVAHGRLGDAFGADGDAPAVDVAAAARRVAEHF